MFLPPKKTIAFHSMLICVLLIGSVDAQQANFDRRMAAMQQARARGAQPMGSQLSQMGVDNEAPPAPPQMRVAQRTNQVQRTNQSQRPQRMAAAPKRVVLNRSQNVQPQRSAQQTQPPQIRSANRVQSYLPQHVRTAQLSEGMMYDGGAPIINPGSMMHGQAIGSGTYMDGGSVIDGGYEESYVGESSCSSGCSTCGDVGENYFGSQCCGRGGCPQGPCWIQGLGSAFHNGEYFAGAMSFRSTLFQTPGGNNGDLTKSDCSFGFYEGFNLGLPLCKLTCGLVSGQVGIRATQSNFNGSDFTPNEREQLFLTAGLYRRVDYGLQYGLVFDYLHEDWYTESDTAQIRSEIGWVFPSGSTLGFRYTVNTNEDTDTVSFNNGGNFNDITQLTEDAYRFFWKYEAASGGYGDMFVGWSENRQTILGIDADLPLTDKVAMQAGFTYYLNADGLTIPSSFQGGNAKEAYNIYVGFAVRPRGRSHYRSYDRPLFPVADNGSMLIKRTN